MPTLVLVLLVGSGGAPAAAAATDSLTARQCVALSQRVAPEVRAAAEAARAAEYDARAARWNAAPQLRLHSGALYAPEGSYDPAITNLGAYDLKLVGTLPLLDGGGRRRERERALTGAALARTELALGERDVALQAAQLALSLLQIAARARRRDETVRWASDVLRAVEAGARAGVRSPSDVARLRLDLHAITTDLADLERQRELQGHALGALLFADSAVTSFTAVRDTTWSERPPSPEDSVALVARFEGSAEVARASAAVRLADLALADARRRGALQLEATADAGLAGTDLTRTVPPELRAMHPNATLRDRLRRDLGASLALDLTLPLIQRGNAATVAARAADLRAALLRLEAARRSGRQAALDLLARWRSGARLLASNREAGTLAEAHVRRVHSLYLSGAATLLELLDARRVLEDALDRLEDARAELNLALLETEIGR